MIELPTLYSKDAKGKLILWRVWNEGDIIVVEHGQVGGRTTKNRDRAQATNVGRANERLGEAQAEFEVQSRWERKIKQGYFESMEMAKTAEVILPMLAHPIIRKFRRKGLPVEEKRAVAYPCHMQRKLNGLRCLAVVNPDGSVTLKSRQGTVWDYLGHIEAAVSFLGNPGDIFDGEVYAHGVPLQTINGWIKNGSDEDAAAAREGLQYHLYDMPSAVGQRGGTWEDRWQELQHRYLQYVYRMTGIPLVNPGVARAWAGKAVYPLQLVETHTAYNEEGVKEFAGRVIAEGYEGVILRQLGHEYTFGKRKEALIKWKDFVDEEFVVKDILSREYFDPKTGQPIHILDKCVCENNLNDRTFEVVPLGTVEEKAQMWADKEQYIGRRLVVRYLERSLDDVPQGNTVGLSFRLDEDLALEDDDDLSMWE